jgi:magnesium/cobalt transport protein CorA
VDVRWVTATAFEQREPDDVPTLVERDDGFLWVDIAEIGAKEESTLSEVFGFHPLAIRECKEPVAVPKLQAYPDHFFLVLHGIEPGHDGQTHVVELDQFISHRYLVTIHSPVDRSGTTAMAAHEVESVKRRIEAGRFRPRSSGELGHAIASGLARHLEGSMSSVAAQITSLERLVMSGDTADSDRVLDEMFRVRHDLLTVRTIAAQSREVYARMAAFSQHLDAEGNVWVVDLLDQFDRLKNLCDGEKELLQEVLDFHQTRIANELNEFVRRLTSVGAILVVCTLIAGIYGMNFQHMPELGWQLGYPAALAIMGVISIIMAIYFRRKRWL